MEAEVARLEAQLAETKARLKYGHHDFGTNLTRMMRNSRVNSRSDPSTTVQRYITLLHEYNEIKDIGQGLTGLIADARGVRHIEVQRDYGVGDQD